MKNRDRCMMDNGILYSGSGVILIECGREPLLIVCREVDTNGYSEPGGRCNKHEHQNSIIKTARAELFEETGTFICFPNAQKLHKIFSPPGETNTRIHNFVDKRHKDAWYRAFVIFTKSINIAPYKANINRLNKNKNIYPGEQFRETDKMTKVSIRKLAKLLIATPGNNRKLWIRDIYGNDIKLNKRLIKVMRKLLFEPYGTHEITLFHYLFTLFKPLLYHKIKDAESGMTHLIYE